MDLNTRDLFKIITLPALLLFSVFDFFFFNFIVYSINMYIFFLEIYRIVYNDSKTNILNASKILNSPVVVIMYKPSLYIATRVVVISIRIIK